MQSNERNGNNKYCATFEKVAQFPEQFLSTVFYKYGKFVARYRFMFLLVSLIILVGLSLGLIRTGTDFQTEDTVTAFIAEGTWLHDNWKQLNKEWPVDMNDYHELHEYFVPEMYFLYVHTPGSSGNVLSSKGKAELLEFCRALEGATASYKGKTLTFEDVCAKSESASGNPTCVRPITCDLAILQTSLGLPDWYPVADLEALISVTEVQKANLSAPYNILGEVITSAGDTNLVWYFQKNDEGFTWQYKVFDELDDLRKSFTNAEYYIYSYGRARHEDKQTFINDMPYLAVGFVLLLVYSCLVTFNLKLKGNRLPLTLGGLVSTLLSMSASFGVMISAGVPFVTFSVIIPFVVFGIGIDAILVLSTEWANCDKISDPNERIGKTMERAFMGISLSHLTSLIAFLVGLVSPFPAVDYLCGYMAVSIAIMWFGEGTLFLSFLSLHGHWAASSDINKTSNDADSDPTPIELIKQNSDRSCVEACLMWILPKTVNNNYFKVIIMMGLGIGVGLAITSVYNMSSEEDYSIYYPDGSSIGEFFDARKEHYPFRSVIFFILDKQLEYSNLETFNLIEEMYADLEKSGLYAKFAASWYSLFLQFEQATGQNSFNGDEDAFVTRLQNWMDNVVVPSDVNYKYLLWLKKDVVIENNRIVRSRFYLQFTGTTADNLDQAKDGLKTLEDTFDKYKDTLAPYSFSFLLAEMDRNLKLLGEVWKSVGIVAAVAVFVTFLFVPDLVVYLLVLFCFFSAMIGAMGLMNAWGFTYALSTYIEIMLGFGLCVDYMAHVAQGYMVSRGKSEPEKIKQVMSIIGVAMTNAVVTSILGVSMLSVAETFANRSFFKAMFLIYLCSYLFGVLLLPVLLAIVRGSFFRKSEESGEEQEHSSRRRSSPVAAIG